MRARLHELCEKILYALFDKNDYVLSDPGFDGFPALDFRTVQHDHYLQGKMAVTPIGQRFEDDCKYYKMTFVEALLIFFLSTGRKKKIFHLTNVLWFILSL